MLSALAEVSSDAWESLKNGVGSACASLQSAFREAVSTCKSEPGGFTHAWGRLFPACHAICMPLVGLHRVPLWGQVAHLTCKQQSRHVADCFARGA